MSEAESNNDSSYRPVENKPYIEAMRLIRRSNAATAHDNRPSRERTRSTSKGADIRQSKGEG